MGTSASTTQLLGGDVELLADAPGTYVCDK
jgi:hypothetical protein